MAAALGIRLLLIATTFGTTDAFLFMIWTHLAEHNGIAGAYALVPLLNHPPLSMAIAIAADRLGASIGLEFPDIFRLVQVLADILTASVVYALARTFQPARAREYTALFFASPAAIMLSGFHCNSDPTMVALLMTAVWAAVTQRAALSGTFFGLSSGIKIVPLPLSPFFLIDFNWRRRIAFAAATLVAIAIAFLPGATGGLIMIRNVLGYAGTGYQWGFSGLGYITAYIARPLMNAGFAWMMFYSQWGRWIVILALGGLFFFYLRYRTPLPAMIAVALLAMNFFSPGFGVQYLIWPLALLPFAVPRRLAYTINLALSVFLFATYTIWSREFPWWFADAAANNPYRPIIAFLAIPLWALYGVAIFVSLRQSARQLASEQLAEGRAGN